MPRVQESHTGNTMKIISTLIRLYQIKSAVLLFLEILTIQPFVSATICKDLCKKAGLFRLSSSSSRGKTRMSSWTWPLSLPLSLLPIWSSRLLRSSNLCWLKSSRWTTNKNPCAIMFRGLFSGMGPWKQQADAQSWFNLQGEATAMWTFFFCGLTQCSASLKKLKQGKYERSFGLQESSQPLFDNLLFVSICNMIWNHWAQGCWQQSTAQAVRVMMRSKHLKMLSAQCDFWWSKQMIMIGQCLGGQW